MPRRQVPVIGLVALTSAAVQQADTPDRLARTDAAIERLRRGERSRDDALYLLSSYWTGEHGRQLPSVRTMVVTWAVTVSVCLAAVIAFGSTGIAVLAAVFFGGGLLWRAAVELRRRRRDWYGSRERRTAVRSLVGVALDVVGVYRDGYRLPREARVADTAEH
jgi:hypothetical protein